MFLDRGEILLQNGVKIQLLQTAFSAILKHLIFFARYFVFARRIKEIFDEESKLIKYVVCSNCIYSSKIYLD